MTRLFWLLSLSFFLATITTQSMLTHHVAFLVNNGLEALFAFYIVGIIGIVSLACKILEASLSDKIGRELTYTIGTICCIRGLVALILFRIYPTSILPYAYAVFSVPAMPLYQPFIP
jgi:uncharacterized membrane protein